MTKKIVLCFDGTWNDPSSNTNVVKIHRSIVAEDKTPSKLKKQIGGSALTLSTDDIKWYDAGVGTGFMNKYRGGILGRGLSKNIRQGYLFIVDNYVQGDEIYLFGFSRGSYTARSLVGLIRNIGILKENKQPGKDVDKNDILNEGFELYQKRDDGADTDEAKAFRVKHSHDNVRIEFLGIWDTVGALGIPSNKLKKMDEKYLFHDTRLSGRVNHAYHALAIDETRPEFAPTLWTSTAATGQQVEQTWFSGVHSEVGGGNKPSLTDAPLRWMQDKAIATGLKCDSAQMPFPDEQSYIKAKVHNHFSFRKWYRWVAMFRGTKPYIRPIDTTPIECLHSFSRKKIDAKNKYRPKNNGLDTITSCP